MHGGNEISVAKCWEKFSRKGSGSCRELREAQLPLLQSLSWLSPFQIGMLSPKALMLWTLTRPGAEDGLFLATLLALPCKELGIQFTDSEEVRPCSLSGN